MGTQGGHSRLQDQRNTSRVDDRRWLIRTGGGRKWLKRQALEFGVRFGDGRNQQKQMIHTYLRRVPLVALFS